MATQRLNRATLLVEVPLSAGAATTIAFSQNLSQTFEHGQEGMAARSGHSGPLLLTVRIHFVITLMEQVRPV
jgi:hypothetical protein